MTERSTNQLLLSGTAANETEDPIGRDLILPNGYRAAAYLDCTVLTGTTPTLDVTIEGKDETSGKYFLIGTFAPLSAAGSERIVTTDIALLLDRTVRARAAIGGTTVVATFTVSITVKI